MIKYKLKYKGKLYRVIIRELKYGVISDKKDIGNKIYLIFSISFSYLICILTIFTSIKLMHLYF